MHFPIRTACLSFFLSIAYLFRISSAYAKLQGNPAEMQTGKKACGLTQSRNNDKIQSST
jgi:hypothetical protein